MLVIKDFATTTLASALTAAATTITVADGSRLPVLDEGDYYYLVLQKFVDRTSVEIVKVTGVAGNVLTVVRGQDGTTGKAFSIGDYAEVRLTVRVFAEYVAQSIAGKVDKVSGYVEQGLELLNTSDAVRASLAVRYDVSFGHGTIISGAEGANRATPYIALRPLGKSDSSVQAKYGEDGTLSLAGGTRAFVSGFTASTHAVDANGWPVSANGDANNYVNRARQKTQVNNNGLFVIADAAANVRRFGLQVGNADPAFSTQYGILELNPYGGLVKVNGGTVYHTNYVPTPAEVGSLALAGGIMLGKAWFTGSATGINIEGGVGTAGTQGDLRFNTTLLEFEGYASGEWKPVGGGGSVTWTSITANTAAQVGKGYLVNAAGLTVTLPANPAVGKTVGIGDYNSKNYTVTVARNGKKIMGRDEDFVFNTKNSNIVLAYIDATVGWILTQGFGESQAPYAIFNKARFTDVAGQTTFNFASVASDTVDVYYNGLQLDTSDFTITPTTVTLAAAVSKADDIVRIYGWNQAMVLNAAGIAYDNSVTGISAVTMQQAIDQSYNKKNILGSVSQVGGIPTGAIIERGSNGNGDFVKYADGTMICTLLIASTPKNITTAVGSLFAEAALSTWTYPAVFLGNPAVTVVPVRNAVDATFLLSMVGNIGASAVTYRFGSSVTNSGASVAISLTAIGRWY